MSYAAFVFHTKESGYNFKVQGRNYLSFWYDGGRYYFCQVMPGKGFNDCGYVVISSNDFQAVFEGKNELVKTLLAQCVRTRQKRSDGSIAHCLIDDSLKGKIKTTLDCGTEIKCKYDGEAQW